MPIEFVNKQLSKWANDTYAIRQCSLRAAERIMKRNGGDFVSSTDADVLTVFIHGYLHNETAFQRYDRGIESTSNILRVNISSTNQSIKISAGEIYEKIELFAMGRKGPLLVNLVGHSMGGIIGATLAEKYSSKNFAINKVISIGSPFLGTKLALFGLAKSTREMINGSPFLQDLVYKMQKNQRVRYYFAGSLDDVIIQPWTSCFPFGDHYPHQKKVEGIGHSSLLFDQRVEDWVFACLLDQQPASYA